MGTMDKTFLVIHTDERLLTLTPKICEINQSVQIRDSDKRRQDERSGKQGDMFQEE